MARPDPQRLRFSKMHGAGNDFVVLDRRDEPQPLSPALCRAMADRHAGIGCDQILTVEPAAREGAVASYRIWNADGSPSRQCGNGARCIAAWLVRDGTARGASFELDSPAGRHAVEALGDGRFRIAMGVPKFEPRHVPLRGFDAPRGRYTLLLDDLPFEFGAVSMGNPHAVVEVDDVDAAPVATLAPRVQAHAAFPESVNVGFAQVHDRGRIRLRVYERGVGETLACGSGACAAAAVLMRRGRVDREVVVSLPGGELGIAWPADTAQVAMTGPTTFVFEGEWLS
jgi:diaminopimelate epimerase